MVLPILLVSSYATFLAALLTPQSLPRVGTAQHGGMAHRAGVDQGDSGAQEVYLPYPTPIRQIQLLGLAAGGILAAPLMVILPLLRLPALVGLLMIPLGYLSVASRYVGGWPKAVVWDMERELPGLTSFVLALAGLGSRPIPTALLIYAERFPGRPLASLAGRTPSGEDPVAFLLARGIPSVPVGGVLSVLSQAQDSPRRRDALRRLYEAQERRVRLELERAVEGRLALAPVATVLLLFPALLMTALAPVVVRFLSLLGAVQ